ncbi:hypothetical protein DIPPA_26682 [Diplonema papillatum]|nr:hypothetical protein DIPPA_26682 [Diplonema papillatum]
MGNLVKTAGAPGFRFFGGSKSRSVCATRPRRPVLPLRCGFDAGAAPSDVSLVALSPFGTVSSCAEAATPPHLFAAQQAPPDR